MVAAVETEPMAGREVAVTSGGGIIGVNHVAHLAYAPRADEGMARMRRGAD